MSSRLPSGLAIAAKRAWDAVRRPFSEPAPRVSSNPPDAPGEPLGALRRYIRAGGSAPPAVRDAALRAGRAGGMVYGPASPLEPDTLTVALPASTRDAVRKVLSEAGFKLDGWSDEGETWRWWA